MTEILHTVEHTLGLCGEKHLSLAAILSDWPSFSYLLDYLKIKFK